MKYPPAKPGDIYCKIIATTKEMVCTDPKRVITGFTLNIEQFDTPLHVQAAV